MRRDISRSSNISIDEENLKVRAPIEATLSFLWVLTPLVATVSVLVVFLSIVTNQWLHTEEKMNNPAYNGTGEREYLSKFTISGLWTFCFTNPEAKKKVQCLQCETKDINAGCKAADFRVTEYCLGSNCFAFLDTGRSGTMKVWKRGCTSSKNTCKGQERKGCVLCKEDKCNKVALPDE